METFLIRALQLIMSLSLLVIIHEMGHFLFARLFKTRVEKFCLFFDPWFTLFKFKPKRSETEYAVGVVTDGPDFVFNGTTYSKEELAPDTAFLGVYSIYENDSMTYMKLAIGKDGSVEVFD